MICPITPIGELVLNVQNVPAHRWEGNYFRTAFRFKVDDDDTIKVSFPGGLAFPAS